MKRFFNRVYMKIKHEILRMQVKKQGWHSGVTKQKRNAQTFTDFELILVDDGSPDSCPEICDAYAQKDHRVRVIHQSNQGLSAARNAGINIARGEYLSFVDSDDYVAPDMLETLYALISKNEMEVDMALCQYTAVREDGAQAWKREDVTPGVCTPDQFWELYFATDSKMYYNVAWNKLYSRKLFDSCRYPVGKYLKMPSYYTTLFHPVNTSRCLMKQNTTIVYGQRALCPVRGH